MTLSEWLVALGNLCAGSMPAQDAQIKTRAYAPLLQSRYEPAAFCAKSLEAVAAQSKFWPSYGELCDRLDAWWGANQPQRLAIPHPRALTEQQAAHVACCDRALAEGREPAKVLGVLHAVSGKAAVAEILRDRPGLVPLASKMGWMDDFAPCTPEQRAAIAKGLHELAASLSPPKAKRSMTHKAVQPVREPSRMDKLAVARAATPAVLATRPDLRAVLDAAAGETRV